MTAASEALGQQSAMESALDQGVDILSVRQTVQFQKFTKTVLSQDGFVFWVATSQYVTVDGALHIATDRLQEEDQTIAANDVLLTAEQEITEFNLVDPTTMWVGAWPISPTFALQVAFARRGNYFGPANLWHYRGFAVFPALQAQLVQTAADLPTGPIVSNSLPIWLTLNSYTTATGIVTVPVYPSFLVPDNVVPPYIVAHVEPTGTQALQAFPIQVWPGAVVPNSGASPLSQLASSQLMRDEVDLTFYGFNNQEAIQYLTGVIEDSLLNANFGFANSPAISDAKRTQAEIAVIAQKKTCHISANYYQATADAIARRLILEAAVTVTILTTGTGSASQAASTSSGTGTVS